MNDLLLNALNGTNCSRPPIWLMRQAGRYMPEYMALRQKYSFLQMVHQPELAAEITLLPIDLLGVDAAILFCDILVLLEALGVGLRFDDGIGPIIERPLQTIADIDALQVPKAEEKLNYVAKTIGLLRQQLKVPLIGFAGAPFTLASYMIEGKSSKDLKKTKKWLFQHPDSFHVLLEKISQLTIDYLLLQIKAGAQVIQLFDSWASSLGARQFEEFSLAYFKKIIQALPKEIPVIAFCLGSSLFAPQLATCGATALSIDWNGKLADIRQRVPRQIALQGNLDPHVLYASQPVIKKEVQSLLDSMKDDPAYIFNLGHGILPDIPFNHVKYLVDLVKES